MSTRLSDPSSPQIHCQDFNPTHEDLHIKRRGTFLCIKTYRFFCFSPHSRWTTLILSFQWSWMEVFTRYGFHRVYNSTLKMMACLLASVQKARTPESCPGRFDLCLQNKFAAYIFTLSQSDSIVDTVQLYILVVSG